MKFSELNKGTYVAAKFTEQTLDSIQELQTKLRLLNPVKREDLHTTICYSRTVVPFVPHEQIQHIGTASKLEIWDTDKGPALIMLLDSDYLHSRHTYSKALGATYDFPDYKPHVTLSYNLGVQKVDLLDALNIDIEMSREYVEELDLEWTNDKV